MLSHDFSIKKIENWEKLEKIVSEARSVYTPPSLLGSVLESDSQVYINGHTTYFVFAKGKPDFFRKSNPEETVGHLWDQYIVKIYSKIAAQEFDVVILDQWTTIPGPPPDFSNNLAGKFWLKKHYRLREKLPIFLANRPGGGRYAIEIWEPRPRTIPSLIDAAPAGVIQK